MRTTVTLDSDVEQLLRRLMEERGLSFKEAINQALRAAISGRSDAAVDPYVLPIFHMGYRPEIALDKALALATEDEDTEVLRKMSLRK